MLCLCPQYAAWHLQGLQHPWLWTHSRPSLVQVDDDHPKAQISAEEWTQVKIDAYYQHGCLTSIYTFYWKRWGVNISAYTEYVLHCGVSLLAQDAPIGVKSVDELLRGHHGEGILQQHKGGGESLFSILFFFSRNGNLKKQQQTIRFVDTYQHVQGRRQVVHRKFRKPKTGWLLRAKCGGQWQHLGHSGSQGAAEWVIIKRLDAQKIH